MECHSKAKEAQYRIDSHLGKIRKGPKEISQNPKHESTREVKQKWLKVIQRLNLSGSQHSTRINP